MKLYTAKIEKRLSMVQGDDSTPEAVDGGSHAAQDAAGEIDALKAGLKDLRACEVAIRQGKPLLLACMQQYVGHGTLVKANILQATVRQIQIIQLAVPECHIPQDHIVKACTRAPAIIKRDPAQHAVPEAKP